MEIRNKSTTAAETTRSELKEIEPRRSKRFKFTKSSYCQRNTASSSEDSYVSRIDKSESKKLKPRSPELEEPASSEACGVDLWDTDSVLTRFLDWVCKQDWIEQFQRGEDGLQVAIKNNIAIEEAKRLIGKGGFGSLNCKVTYPDGGEFVQTTQLLPGMEIEHSRRYALCSGSVFGKNIKNQKKHAVTVNHLFDSSGEFRVSCKTTRRFIGTCIAKFNKEFIVRPDQSIPLSADIAFIEINENDWRSSNIISVPPRVEAIVGGDSTVDLAQARVVGALTQSPYKLRIFKNRIKPGMKIMMLKHGAIPRVGMIFRDVFFSDTYDISNALAITDESTNCKISDEGDSGALITSLPVEGSDLLHVVGIVIGIWNNHNRTMTIVNRLWDVIRAIAGNPELRSQIFNDTVHPNDVLSLGNDVEFAGDE